MAGTSISGLKEFYDRMDEFPDRALKVASQAIRAAAKPVTKNIRAGLSETWRPLVKSAFNNRTSRSGQMYVSIGLFNTVPAQDPERELWFKAYWRNYGTLKHRDPNHRFKNPIKKMDRRNQQGQEATHFVDRVLEGQSDIFLREAVREFEKRTKDLVK